MTFTPSGALIEAQHLLADLVAASSTFQAAVGAADAAAARARVHLNAAVCDPDAGYDLPRPYAVVAAAPESEYFAREALGTWLYHRPLWLWFVCDALEPAAIDADATRVANLIEGTVADLLEAVRQGATLPIDAGRWVETPRRTHPVDEVQGGRWWRAILEVELT